MVFHKGDEVLMKKKNLMSVVVPLAITLFVASKVIQYIKEDVT